MSTVDASYLNRAHGEDSPAVDWTHGARQRSDGLWEGVVQIQGIYCSACSVELEQLAVRVSGLRSFTVNPAAGLGRWVASEPQQVAVVARLAQKRGYQFGQGDAKEFLQASIVRERRLSLLRACVALLCVMQIMMYSAPEYFYSVQDIGLSVIRLLRWAQWVLCWPMLLFVAMPLFRLAYLGVRARHWVMEQPVVLGILLAFGYSTFHLNDPTQHVWFDSVGMLVCLLSISRFLLDRYRLDTWSFLAQLRPDLPEMVWVERATGNVQIPSSEAVAGEVLCYPNAQVLAVDGILLTPSAGVWVNESVRTGESIPVHKRPGEALYAGSQLLGDHVRVKVSAGIERGSFGQLGELIQQALTRKPKRRGLIERIIPWFVVAVLVLATIGGGVWWLLGASFSQVVAVFIAILLVTCPCALALAEPLVHLRALRSLAAQGVLVSQPDALGRLTQVDCFAFDKTGTLSHPELGGVNAKLLPSQDVLGWKVDLNSAFGVAALLARHSSHPLSQALVVNLYHQYAQNMVGFDLLNVVEIPGQGVSAVMSVRATGGCLFVRLGNAKFCGYIADSHSNQSVVYLGVSVTKAVESASVHGFIPVLQLEVQQQVKPQDVLALKALRERGAWCLLSGDNQQAVLSWQPDLEFDQRLFEMSPWQKADWIASQQALGRCVAMCGDGLNDAAAFAQADVSFAVQGAATLSAVHADFILIRSNTALVLEVVRVALQAQRLIRQNLIWALAYNLVGVPLAMIGYLTPFWASIGMGVSSLIVVLNSFRLRAKR